MLGLLTSPGWLANIGDRGVTTMEQAAAYIRNGAVVSVAKHGFASFLVSLRSDGTRVGVCGLLQRDTLRCPDLGYALLPQFERQGYAREASAGVLAWAQARGIHEVCAIVSPGNARSCHLLRCLGFREDGTVEGGTTLFFTKALST
jgi:RimJ/RimL family protein N-acetyltransferase